MDRVRVIPSLISFKVIDLARVLIIHININIKLPLKWIVSI